MSGPVDENCVCLCVGFDNDGTISRRSLIALPLDQLALINVSREPLRVDCESESAISGL